MQISVVSRHLYASASKASTHHLAKGLAQLGHEVRFLTVGLSPLSLLGRPSRLGRLRGRHFRSRGRTDGGVQTYVWPTPWHAASAGPKVDRYTSFLGRSYSRLRLGFPRLAIAGADVVLVDSGPGVLLEEAIRELAPDAALGYWACDDLGSVGAHPVIREGEHEFVSHCDWIGVPDERIATTKGWPRYAVHHHGVWPEMFWDTALPSAYQQPAAGHALFIGRSHVDWWGVRTLATAFPEWHIHLIGPFRRRAPRMDNLIVHGEIPFEKTGPFIAHCDVALATRTGAPVPFLGQSLKVIQYAYCARPIVSSTPPSTEVEHAFIYKWGDRDSLVAAFARAASCAGGTSGPSSVATWSDVAQAIIEEIRPYARMETLNR